MFVRALGAPRFLARRKRTQPLKIGGTSTVAPVVNQPPEWAPATGAELTIIQGGTLNLNTVGKFTDPEGDPMSFRLVSGTLPTGVTLNESTGVLSATGSAPLVLSGDIVISASDGSFWDIPSLQDERDFYDNINKPGGTWIRTAGDETFTNWTTSTFAFDVNYDIHGETEGDDLWAWYQHYRRGYVTTQATIVNFWLNKWLTFFRGGTYLSNVTAGASKDADYGYDHLYGTGLVEYGYLQGDSTALAMAEQLGDLAISEWSLNKDGVTPRPPTSGLLLPGRGGSFRATPRFSILFTYLAQAIGSSKWIFWRDAVLDNYANTTSWQDTTSAVGNIAAGGHYMVPRGSLAAAGADSATQGVNWNFNGTQADYDAGRRFNNTFYFALQAEAVWRGYLATGRSDLRAKLIAMARYVSFYAHDPGDPSITSWGGPYVGHYFGSQSVNGPYYHRHTVSGGTNTSGYNAPADAQVVNTLVFGYKLTGETAMLDAAKSHFRIGTRWTNQEAPGSPNPPGYGSGPNAATNEVLYFIDTHADNSLKVFQYDKGQFRYCYALFENGGNPTVIP